MHRIVEGPPIYVGGSIICYTDKRKNIQTLCS